MFLRRVVLPLVFATLVAASSAAFASTGEAAQFIHRLGNQTTEILRALDLTLDQRQQRIRGLMGRVFDIPFIGRFVIRQTPHRPTR